MQKTKKEELEQVAQIGLMMIDHLRQHHKMTFEEARDYTALQCSKIMNLIETNTIKNHIDSIWQTEKPHQN